MGAGIDYGSGQTNIDHDTKIRYGVISQDCVLQAWADSSEANYGVPCDVICPNCDEPFDADNQKYGDFVECYECGKEFELEVSDMAEPVYFEYTGDGYVCSQGQDGDIFVIKSPFFTRAAFCSPCAPGACHLEMPNDDGARCYCFGHDWFENGKAPYPVYSVKTGKLIESEGEK